MSKLEVFEAGMCCSTGVCGPAVDEILVQFAGDFRWLKAQGVKAERFNLASAPGAFVANSVVREALQAKGESCLPLFLVDGKVEHSGSYPDRKELSRWFGVVWIQSLPALAGTAVRKNERLDCPDENCCSGEPGECC